MNQMEFNRAHNLLSKNFPVYNWTHFDIDRYIQFLSKDKKNVGNDLVCILAEGPGRIAKQRISMDESFRGILREYFSTALPSAINHQE